MDDNNNSNDNNKFLERVVSSLAMFGLDVRIELGFIRIGRRIFKKKIEKIVLFLTADNDLKREHEMYIYINTEEGTLKNV